jgi:F-type H+-transporting ATPase subunit beta
MDDGGVTAERMKRTRRLCLFLTQSYHGTEMWTGKPGEAIPLAHTVETCRRILDGEYDDVPEKAFYLSGRMEGILERVEKIGD